MTTANTEAAYQRAVRKGPRNSSVAAQEEHENLLDSIVPTPEEPFDPEAFLASERLRVVAKTRNAAYNAAYQAAIEAARTLTPIVNSDILVACHSFARAIADAK